MKVRATTWPPAVDASTMPTITSGHPASPTIMIPFCGAQAIRAARRSTPAWKPLPTTATASSPSTPATCARSWQPFT
ncbi:MAG: hypothetical protein KF710_06575 [Rhodocyclaceae bacterium]|nr:hypothetical protein [Rhodocyclaceae bacterium]MCB1899590.1 hypothetical protein [Rhodocyclaceae bacterium]